MAKIDIDINGESIELTPKQKRFCELYVSKEFFANGTESYIESYNVDTKDKGAYQSAKSSASRMLTNDNVLNYINHLLDLSGLNDEFVDKQLTFIITQNAELSTKLGGIREYNKLKKRIEERLKQDVTISFK